jgi:hypothetical protein
VLIANPELSLKRRKKNNKENQAENNSIDKNAITSSCVDEYNFTDDILHNSNVYDLSKVTSETAINGINLENKKDTIANGKSTQMKKTEKHRINKSNKENEKIAPILFGIYFLF